MDKWIWSRRPRTEHNQDAVHLAACWLAWPSAFTIETLANGRLRMWQASGSALRLELGERVAPSAAGGELPKESDDDIIARCETMRGFVPFVDYVREVA